MTGFSRNATDKNLKAWLNAGPVDRGVGDGLTFFAKEASARDGKASWILRYRYGVSAHVNPRLFAREVAVLLEFSEIQRSRRSSSGGAWRSAAARPLAGTPREALSHPWCE